MGKTQFASMERSGGDYWNLTEKKFTLIIRNLSEEELKLLLTVMENYRKEHPKCKSK